jgi:serine/threonine-protein kinase
MIACPGREELEEYCAEALPPGRLAEVEAHLAGCASCNEQLERISREALRELPLDAPGPVAPTPAGVPGYELIERLGAGGMGVVWKARQVALDRMVALKFLGARSVAGDEAWERFRTEAEAVARLGHPNVVGVYDFNLASDRPYFAMELVEGGTLADELAAGSWPADRASVLVECVARAVHEAHARGILHRDLKPGNILLTRDRIPKVADFGLAKRLDADAGAGRTRTGQRMGTPAYMSPEQIAGRSAGVGADVYALGVILYQLLTGRVPFDGPDAEAIWMQALTRDPAPPRRVQPGVPRDLETICLRRLEKEPGRRFTSCAELAEDLRRSRAGEVIRSRPAGRPARAGLALVPASSGAGGIARRAGSSARGRARLPWVCRSPGPGTPLHRVVAGHQRPRRGGPRPGPGRGLAPRRPGG